MALLNKFTTDSGLELDLYYCVTSIDTRGHIALDGYISKEARDEWKQPVNRITYNYDCTINKMIEWKQVRSERYIDKKDINLENIYNFVKENQEFSNSKDA